MTWVLLHGFTGAPASFDPLLPHLDPAEPIERPLLLGHLDCRSTRPTFEAEVSRLLELLAERDRLPARVLGYSLGARVALGMAAQAPEAVRALVLLGVHPGLEDAAERDRRRTEDEARAAQLIERGLAAFISEWESNPLFASQGGLPAPLLKAQRELRLRHHAAGLARSLRVLGLGAMPSYWDNLVGLSCPVALITGALDPKFSAIAREVAARRHAARGNGPGIDSFRWNELPGVGHNAVLEAPEAVARAMTETDLLR